MSLRFVGVLVVVSAAVCGGVSYVLACCPAPRSGKPVVNADQTVIILWDAATKTQHFIRKASFKSDGEDFGFLVPTPSQPELEESGNEAFPVLQKLTEPVVKVVTRGSGGRSGGVGCGCGDDAKLAKTSAPPPAQVKVLQEKEVAGFKAAVLKADTTEVLVEWLKNNGYAFSPEVAAWAKPYVGNEWKITAMKVAKAKEGAAAKEVSAAALRISFKTDRPLFPYREPESTAAATALNAKKRLLRIYFISDGRYEGELTKESPWTGKAAWSNSLSAAKREEILDLLKLSRTTGPADGWLTEFEDPWPYAQAPADLYFARAANQTRLEREPIIRYAENAWPSDVTAYALLGLILLARRRGRKPPVA